MKSVLTSLIICSPSGVARSGRMATGMRKPQYWPRPAKPIAFSIIFSSESPVVNLYFARTTPKVTPVKRLPALDIHVRKWFTPSIGACRQGPSGQRLTTAGTDDALLPTAPVPGKIGNANACRRYVELRNAERLKRPYVELYLCRNGVGWARLTQRYHDNEWLISACC